MTAQHHITASIGLKSINTMARGVEVVSVGWKLVDGNGVVVITGQNCPTFRNENCTVYGGTPPHKPESTGRIDTSQGEFGPSVCNLKWVAA